jgi:hypothetical protein
MTAADVLYQAEAAGCTIRVRDGKPTVTGRPNAALLAALTEHREGILDILLGPTVCDLCRARVHPENGSRIDFVRVCEAVRCPYRRAGHDRG